VIPRFVKLDAASFVAIETLIELFWERLLPGKPTINLGMFQLLRDNDLALAERFDDLRQVVETGIRMRHKANVVRLKFNRLISESSVTFVATCLGILDEDDVAALAANNESLTRSEFVTVDSLLGLSDTVELIVSSIGDEQPELSFDPFESALPQRLRDADGDCFATIRDGDLMLHWPFETFNVVVHFLEQAAADPDVLAIKQTRYRTSDNSPIVSAVVDAAVAGKSVTAIVELEARDNGPS